MKIKIKTWMIFTEFGTQAVPYIFNQPKDVDDDEIALGIQEQIYGDGEWQ